MISSRLSGRICLITGASGGLGIYLARTLWQAGASLLITGRNRQRLEDLQEELAASARADQRLAVIACDLSNPESVRLLTLEVESQRGPLTVLVNNAGILGPIGPIWQNDQSEWELTIRVNLIVPAALCAAIIPGMRNRGYGKIINVSGGGATSPRPNFSAYAAAKTGLVRLTEVLAHETKGFGIDVNCIAPGPMNTPMLDEVLAAGPECTGVTEYAKAQRQAIEGGVSPQRAAELALFLACPDSDGITGRLISAVWDPWEMLPQRRTELNDNDVYTLRRIVPTDRGLAW